MAVIRTVSTITHYNMDISEEELTAVLASLRFRKATMGLNNAVKATTINLIKVIEGRLTDG